MQQVSSAGRYGAMHPATSAPTFTGASSTAVCSYQGPRAPEPGTGPAVVLCAPARPGTQSFDVGAMAQTMLLSVIFWVERLRGRVVSERLSACPRYSRRGPTRSKIFRWQLCGLPSRVRVARKSGDSLYDRKVAQNTPGMSTISGVPRSSDETHAYV